MSLQPKPSTGRTAPSKALRRVGWARSWSLALLLLVVAAVHLNLYAGEGYRFIPTIGTLFLLTAIFAVVSAAAVVVSSSSSVAAASGLFSLSVLGGYLLTLLLPHGLFGFKEPGVSYAGWISILAEVAIALLAASGILLRRTPPPSGRHMPGTGRDVRAGSVRS